LQELRLEDNSLSGTLPSFLGSLRNLQDLELHENSLSGTLPSEYGSLSNLQELRLDDNERDSPASRFSSIRQVCP